jgi:ADP-ribose pyrophosphatase
MSNRVIEKQVLYDGKRLRLELHNLEDEETGRRHKREVCVHPGAVVVLPFVDPEHIILIRNRRYAVGETLVELPAGTLEKGEDPMNCAGRELVEETGFLAGRLKSLGDFYTSPGILSEKMYAFAAYDLTRATASLDEGEEIDIAPASLEEAIDMIRYGQIKDAKTIATLLMYERFFRKA